MFVYRRITEKLSDDDANLAGQRELIIYQVGYITGFTEFHVVEERHNGSVAFRPPITNSHHHGSNNQLTANYSYYDERQLSRWAMKTTHYLNGGEVSDDEAHEIYRR